MTLETFLPGSRTGSRPTAPAGRIGILYENDDWLGELTLALDCRAIRYDLLRMDGAAVWLDDPPGHGLVVNLTSPSSYLRDHAQAIPFARSMLEVLDAHGARVVNGARAFHLETSKVAQHLLFRRLGLHAPPTLLFNRREQALEAARAFPFPAFLKPDCGGSGAFVRRVENLDHLAAILEQEPFGPDNVLLLQEELVPRDGAIVRLELVDGELVYAMKVRATNTFNLCPADVCERVPANSEGARPKVEFEPYLDVPPAAVAQTRELLRAAFLDVGGIEYVEVADGRRILFDVNATSVYRADVSHAWGVDGPTMLVDFLERELAKEVAKRPTRARA